MYNISHFKNELLRVFTSQTGEIPPNFSGQIFGRFKMQETN